MDMVQILDYIVVDEVINCNFGLIGCPRVAFSQFAHSVISPWVYPAILPLGLPSNSAPASTPLDPPTLPSATSLLVVLGEQFLTNYPRVCTTFYPA